MVSAGWPCAEPWLPETTKGPGGPRGEGPGGRAVLVEKVVEVVRGLGVARLVGVEVVGHRQNGAGGSSRARLPTMLEFLTLSLTAGEGMLDALRRVARAGSGELPSEFARVVAAAGAGVSLPTALAELRDGLDHPALTRALDQVLGALDRGAPLAAVLRAQAGDARAEAKRTIIELAGRKEIAMLVPNLSGL